MSWDGITPENKIFQDQWNEIEAIRHVLFGSHNYYKLKGANRISR
jgi:hypothetical protein